MSEFYERCEGVNLWINIVLTVLISPSLLIGKILWDRCNNRRNDTVIMKNKLQLKNTSEKLTKKAKKEKKTIKIKLNHGIEFLIVQE